MKTLLGYALAFAGFCAIVLAGLSHHAEYLYTSWVVTLIGFVMISVGVALVVVGKPQIPRQIPRPHSYGPPVDFVAECRDYDDEPTRVGGTLIRISIGVMVTAGILAIMQLIA